MEDKKTRVKKINLKKILGNAFKMIYDTGIYLLIFELIYKGLMLIVFKPLLNTIISLFIRAKGYEILVNSEVSQFLFSFTGILMVIVVMTLSVFLVYYEFAVILLILDRGNKKEKIKLLEITETALLRLKKIITNKQIGLAFYILVLIPIVNIGVQSSLLPILSIPDFITGEVGKYPGSGVLFFALGLSLVYLFSKLFIVLPIMMFSGKSFKEASKTSFATIKGEGLQIAFLIALGMIVWISLTYLPFILVKNAQFILLRILRGIFNISMTIFTLLISPFILAISLESYNSYVKVGDLTRQTEREKIKLGFMGRKIWFILEKIFGVTHYIVSKVRQYIKTFIVISLVLIVAFNIYDEESVSSIYDQQLVIGHRGGYYGVENTIETMMYAGENGADYIEMDVLLTKDNVPVVIHDNNLRRLANVSQNISGLTLDQVKEITITGGGKEGKIPSLEELAIVIKGKSKLLLEFKTHGEEKDSIVDRTIEVLNEVGILKETLFQSSDLQIIEEFNEKNEHLPIGYIFIGKLGTFSDRKMAKMPVDFISAEESLIDKSMIRAIHKSGKALFAWTINDDYKARRLFELGVDGIITDYPIEMVEIRDHYEDYKEKEIFDWVK